MSGTTTISRNPANETVTLTEQLRRARIHLAAFTLGSNVVVAIALFFALRHC